MYEGWPEIPSVSCHSLPIISTSSSREDEVLIMGLMYKNNLLNSFLYRVDNASCSSPLCTCGVEEQTAIHILTSSPLVDISLRVEAQRIMMFCNDLSPNPIGNPIFNPDCTILNCSRDPKFMCLCAEIVKTEGLNLNRKINITK